MSKEDKTRFLHPRSHTSLSLRNAPLCSLSDHSDATFGAGEIQQVLLAVHKVAIASFLLGVFLEDVEESNPVAIQFDREADRQSIILIDFENNGKILHLNITRS